MRMKSAGRKKNLDMMGKLMKMKKMRMKMRMKRRKKVGRVKREREKQMTKEKMIKTRNNLQETELLSIGWTAHGFGSCFKKVAVIQPPGHPHPKSQRIVPATFRLPPLAPW